MVLQNHTTIAARFSSTTHSMNSNNSQNNNNNMDKQSPILDLLVALILVPVLILCALQLEKNLHMSHGSENRWLVFALGIGMLVISIIICGYVTHRMGVCIWVGPIDEEGNPIDESNHINSQADILRFVDTLPPSYESVVKCDLPPPPYECLVIDIEQSRDEIDNNSNKPPEEIVAIHI